MLANQAARRMTAAAIQVKVLLADLEMNVVVAFILDDTTGSQVQQLDDLRRTFFVQLLTHSQRFRIDGFKQTVLFERFQVNGVHLG
jgi:hypothetical protein